jgi:hypothetical protein
MPDRDPSGMIVDESDKGIEFGGGNGHCLKELFCDKYPIFETISILFETFIVPNSS